MQHFFLVMLFCINVSSAFASTINCSSAVVWQALALEEKDGVYKFTVKHKCELSGQQLNEVEFKTYFRDDLALEVQGRESSYVIESTDNINQDEYNGLKLSITEVRKKREGTLIINSDVFLLEEILNGQSHLAFRYLSRSRKIEGSGWTAYTTFEERGLDIFKKAPDKYEIHGVLKISISKPAFAALPLFKRMVQKGLASDVRFFTSYHANNISSKLKIY